MHSYNDTVSANAEVIIERQFRRFSSFEGARSEAVQLLLHLLHFDIPVLQLLMSKVQMPFHLRISEGKYGAIAATMASCFSPRSSAITLLQ